MLWCDASLTNYIYVYILPLIFAYAFCFYALSSVIDSLFISSIILHHAQYF